MKILKSSIFVFLLAIPVFAEQPYQYSTLAFNKGMTPAAGLLSKDDPIDVQNTLWDVSGFMYPRSAFKLFNGRLRTLGTAPVGGMYRYIRRPLAPLFTASSFFLVADSQFIWQDSSVSDSQKAFKKQPIGTMRGTVTTASGTIKVIGTGVQKWIKYVIPKDPFLGGIIDSATYFRLAGRARIKVNYVLGDDTLELSGNTDSTATGTANYAVMPTYDMGSQKFFAGNANLVWFSDSTKPVSAYDGSITPVSFVVDSGRVYANTTTLLRDNTKAWFPNQWRGYWVRFAHRIEMDRGGAGGADSMTRSPWVPITGNTDTSLTLRFDPLYGDANSTYYIMALPVERYSLEQTITATFTPNDSMFRSTTTGYAFGHGDNAITSYPLSVFFTTAGTVLSPAPQGMLRMVSAVHDDSIFLFDEKATTASLNTGGRFNLIENTPIIPHIITTHQDRTWYVDQSRPNRVYYSEPLQPGNVGPFNYIDVFPREGDVLTNLSSYNGELLAYKNNSIVRITGDNPSNYIAEPFLDNMGTPGINTRTSYGGDEYFYDYRTGIYAIREFNPVRLSDPIRPLFDSIPSGAAKNAALTVFKDHLWFAYPSGSNQSTNNRLISYNVRISDVPTWSRHSFTRAANFAVWALAGDSTRLTLADPDSGLVYVYTDTAHIDAYQSNLIKAVYKTGWLSLSAPELRKRLRGFQLAFDADTITGATVDKDTVYFYKDFATAAHDTLILNRQGTFNNYTTNDLNALNLGRFFQLEMRIAPRTTFKTYYARYKFTNTGEKQ